MISEPLVILSFKKKIYMKISINIESVIISIQLSVNHWSLVDQNNDILVW
jgi:hypothetical protein